MYINTHTYIYIHAHICISPCLSLFLSLSLSVSLSIYTSICVLYKYLYIESPLLLEGLYCFCCTWAVMWAWMKQYSVVTFFMCLASSIDTNLSALILVIRTKGPYATDKRSKDSKSNSTTGVVDPGVRPICTCR